jgi:hypothetical protein
MIPTSEFLPIAFDDQFDKLSRIVAAGGEKAQEAFNLAL